MRLRLSFSLTLIAAVLVAASTGVTQRGSQDAAAAVPAAPSGERTGDVIVRFKDGSSLASVAGTLGAAETAADTEP